MSEKIGTLFREQGITIFLILTALSMTISTIVLTNTGAFGGGGGGGGRRGEGSSQKDEGFLKNRLNRLGDALKRLAGKAVETLRTIMGSVVDVILSFLGNTVGFVAKNA